jgi:hypothetical protein
MLKYTDAFTMIHQKMTRNKSAIAIIQLKSNKIDLIIEFQTKIKTYYQFAIDIYKEINEIEQLQTNEYTIARELQINNLHDNTVASGINDTINDEYKKKEQEIVRQIDYHMEIIAYLNTQIPKTGTITNYSMRTVDPNQTCHEAGE